mmetsp:Transcript_35591/g.111900  ORF Transcript_35591/g.111900 Transcript_35591/m.111900 type:complete len:252 (-) Transcript_35591:893-1648(-)
MMNPWVMPRKDPQESQESRIGKSTVERRLQCPGGPCLPIDRGRRRPQCLRDRPTLMAAQGSHAATLMARNRHQYRAGPNQCVKWRRSSKVQERARWLRTPRTVGKRPRDTAEGLLLWTGGVLPTNGLHHWWYRPASCSRASERPSSRPLRLRRPPMRGPSAGTRYPPFMRPASTAASRPSRAPRLRGLVCSRARVAPRSSCRERRRRNRQDRHCHPGCPLQGKLPLPRRNLPLEMLRSLRRQLRRHRRRVA